MLTIVFTVLPIFAIIGAGYGAGRFGLLGPEASSVLNRYVVYLALPALLFQIMAQASWAQLWQPGFIAAFCIGTFGVFVATLLARAWAGRPLADAAIDGLNTGYANTGYIGLPLCEAVFGPASLPFATIATLLTACVVFGVAIAAVELGLQTDARPHRVALKVFASLAKNPMLIAPFAGFVWSAARIPLAGPLETFVRLMAASTTPCALASLGLFISIPRGDPGARALPWALTLLKLVGQPLLTWMAAAWLLRLPRDVTAIAVVAAALPTGAGPFMLAEYYRREAVVTAKTILISTTLSVLTVTALIYLLRSGH